MQITRYTEVQMKGPIGDKARSRQCNVSVRQINKRCCIKYVQQSSVMGRQSWQSPRQQLPIYEWHKHSSMAISYSYSQQCSSLRPTYIIVILIDKRSLDDGCTFVSNTSPSSHFARRRLKSQSCKSKQPPVSAGSKTARWTACLTAVDALLIPKYVCFAYSRHSHDQ